MSRYGLRERDRVCGPVLPVADPLARCSPVQLGCRLRISPVTASPVKLHVHFFFSTDGNQMAKKKKEKVTIKWQFNIFKDWVGV